MNRAHCPVVMGLLVLPSYAAAQDLPTDPPSGYFDAVASNPEGNVEEITYGAGYPARVYTPPGYSEDQTYATMYLMHGLGGSERSWHDNDLYAHIQLDNLIAEGAVDPFVMVFTRNDLNDWNFEGPLIDELIPYIEANYSVSTDPNHRALGGLSMGGMQTINIGFPNADEFFYLMPSSSAPGIHGEDQLFPDGGELARSNLKLIFFSAGENEIGAYGEQNNTRVMGYCENAGISADIIHEYFAPGGGHDRNTWRPSFWNFAQLAHQAGFTNVGGDMGGSGGMGAGGTSTAGGGGTTAEGGTTGGAGADVGVAGAGSGLGGSPGDVGNTSGAGGTPDEGGGQEPAVGGGGSGLTGSSGDVPGTNVGDGTMDPGSGADIGTEGVGSGGGATGSGGGAIDVTVPAPSGIAATGGPDAAGTTTPADDGTDLTGTAPSATPSGVGARPAADSGGCGCSLPGSRNELPPLALFIAAAVVVGAARIRRRGNPCA